MKAATAGVSSGFGAAPISIHAAREGGDRLRPATTEATAISIHAAREGGDAVGGIAVVGGVTISIHAAREGGDTPVQTIPT